MANDVFANGREIACKAGAGKTICAFPDVCFTPPENPATPPGVPVPYPNTGFASDTTKGSKTVKISGKEIMLKNKSYFKTSTGDEAGCAAKKGVITSKNKGKVYFKAWSMDVKFEGENVDRHLDLTTNNHGSDPGDTPPWRYLETGAVPPDDHPCKTQIERAQEDCSDSREVTIEKTSAQGNKRKEKRRICDAEGKCEAAMCCVFVPKKDDKKRCCAPSNTGHHIIEDHWVKDSSDFDWYHGYGTPAPTPDQRAAGHKSTNDAPTMCVNKSRYEDRHGIAHGTAGVVEDTMQGKDFSYGQGKAIGLTVHDHAFPDCDCPDDCIESQLDSFYGDDNDRNLNSPHATQPQQDDQREEAYARFNITN